jgi:hypothetical protein
LELSEDSSVILRKWKEPSDPGNDSWQKAESKYRLQYLKTTEREIILM